VSSCLSNSWGNFKIDPWQTDPNFSYEEGASSVLFLPGIKASRLYNKSGSTCPYDVNNNELIWEPNCSQDVRDLYLDEYGKSLNSNIYTKEGGVIDETPSGANIYRSFIERMDELKNVDKSINDWKPVSYDWRLSLNDILEDDSIESNLKDLAESSKTKKVTIIAHSNGGLLAKALLQKIGDEETQKLIDKVIFVAVPQVGTPAAMAGLLHGEKQGVFPVFSAKDAREFGANMLSAYNLLPSEGYFATVQKSVASFDIRSKSELKDRYSDNIDSYSEFEEFMKDDFHRVSATCSELNIPIKLNLGLLEKSKNLHEDLDNWTAPEGVNVIQIAGWGVTKTLAKTEYEDEEKNYCDDSVCVNGMDTLNPDFKFTIDGDGTVIAPSALWMNGGERYWVDLKKYNTNHKVTLLFGMLSLNHSNIFEIEGLDSFIVDKITNTERPISEYQYISDEVPASTDKKRLQYSLHSPLTLGLYDTDGRYTGVNSSGEIEEQIPGTYYVQFGDIKYLFADEDISGHIEMKGYDNGEFTFTVEEFTGDQSTGKITFKDMPTTPQTKVNFEVTGELLNASDLEIDEDGDGKSDYVLEAKINEEVTLYDKISPALKITSPEEKIYLKNKMLDIAYAVSDNKSDNNNIDIIKILDNQNIIENKIDLSLLKTGSHRLDIEAIDEAGNKTNREVKFILSTNVKVLIDNISHYYDLKLIKKESEKKMLDNNLKVVQREIEFYKSIKNNVFIKNKTKEKIIEFLEKTIQLHLDTIGKKIEQDKKNYATIIREIIIDDISFIRNNF
ncbi:MAG: alpha/beta hydrolase, partial [Candidatus Moranbacteria bacterium]|nr:alpha/beta hydrolase [Candidatus Moranbacteria bacterium]